MRLNTKKWPKMGQNMTKTNKRNDTNLTKRDTKLAKTDIKMTKK